MSQRDKAAKQRHKRPLRRNAKKAAQRHRPVANASEKIAGPSL